MKNDNVNNPKHYQGFFGLEVHDVMKNFLPAEWLKGAYVFNILKYILRFPKKNGLEDVEKAEKYIKWLKELMEKENEKSKT